MPTRLASVPDMQDAIDRLTVTMPDATVTYSEDGTRAVLIDGDTIVSVRYDMPTWRVFVRGTVVDPADWRTIDPQTLSLFSELVVDSSS